MNLEGQPGMEEGVTTNCDVSVKKPPKAVAHLIIEKQYFEKSATAITLKLQQTFPLLLSLLPPTPTTAAPGILPTWRTKTKGLS